MSIVWHLTRASCHKSLCHSSEQQPALSASPSMMRSHTATPDNHTVTHCDDDDNYDNHMTTITKNDDDKNDVNNNDN